MSIYVKEGLTILVSNGYSNEECGVAHVRVKEINGANIFSLYRPPTASVKSFEEILEKMREWITGDSGELTVMGDFNLGEMGCWGNLQIEELYKRAGGKMIETGVKTMSALKWVEFCEEQGLLQLVKTGTRGGNILDCIFSNSPYTRNINIEVNTQLTDHGRVIMD